ncbi:MAG: formate dehydrogenase accessory sulfurtransferase FdhD [Chitinispirillaceae bacterium]|nr:formate dehydrogenase accessory sulfurtransferase FdhD [Chitinispirillaceae bacterium]
MKPAAPFGMVTPFDVVRVKQGKAEPGSADVATEVPLTIFANDQEIATLACSPGNLKEFVYGFLFSAGFIQTAQDVRSISIDSTRWVIHVELGDPPDPALLTKRLFTSGCGRGVMFSNVVEMAQRSPLQTDRTIKAGDIPPLMHWLQTVSSLHKRSGGVHTAALSKNGALPDRGFDDVGRHNAVDKVIGAGLLAAFEFNDGVLISSGRISSEILFKARRSGIPIVVSLGSVTNQTVLLGRSMGMTVAGFARGNAFTVYSHPERVKV